MAKKIKSDALWLMNRVLGIAGPGAPITEITDGTLEQVIDVTPVIRRSLTLAGTQGLFGALMENVHPVGNEQIVTTVNPYQVPIGVQAPYPDPVGPDFDIWVVGCSALRASGGGSFQGMLEMQSTNTGWGVDDQGAAVTGDTGQPLAFFDGFVTALGRSFGITMDTRNRPYVPLNFRIPTGGQAQLLFRSFSNSPSTWRLHLWLGLFPVSLGQDAQG